MVLSEIDPALPAQQAQKALLDLENAHRGVSPAQQVRRL
jgi:hypothetical protein